MSEPVPDVTGLARQFLNDPVKPRFDVLLPAPTLTSLYYEACKHIRALLPLAERLPVDLDGRFRVWVVRWWDEHNDEIGVYASRAEAVAELASVAAHCADVTIHPDAVCDHTSGEEHDVALVGLWAATAGRGYELAAHAIGTQRSTRRT